MRFHRSEPDKPPVAPDPMAEFSKRLRTSIQAAEEALAHQDDPDFMDYVRKAQGPIHEAAEAGEEVRQEILRRQR